MNSRRSVNSDVMRILLYLTVLMFATGVVRAQNDRPVRLIPEKNFIAEPFDRIGNISWEHEKARLDNFAIAIQNDPKMIGYMSCSQIRAAVHLTPNAGLYVPGIT